MEQIIFSCCMSSALGEGEFYLFSHVHKQIADFTPRTLATLMTTLHPMKFDVYLRPYSGHTRKQINIQIGGH
jgi:hypothetical protein